MAEAGRRSRPDGILSHLAAVAGVHGPALLGFTLLSVVLTYPLVFKAGSSVKDAGDPLFNSWILAWNAVRLIHGRFAGFFDANMFFPAPNTLAYSEFLFSQSLVATPILSISGNPILAHNVAVLVSLATSAFAAYLLAAHLTNRTGGVVAGLIYGFNPFMFSHLSHVQVLAAGGIPLAFLYLHKFFATGRTAHLLMFTGFYVVQALANGYYAVYLTFFAGLFIVVQAVRHGRYAHGRFWAQLGLHTGVSLAALAPFYSRYLTLRHDLGFVIRREVSHVTLGRFLAAPDFNWLYGKATAPFQAPEMILFPGACAVLLALVGAVGMRWLRIPLRHTGRAWVAPVYRTLGWALVPFVVAALWVLIFGGFDTTLGSIRIRATSFRNPVAFIVFLGFARAVMKWRFRIVPAGNADIGDTRVAYFTILCLALLLTIPGPSALLYGSVPGFDGLRAVSRAHVITMLAIAILAAHGIETLLRRMGGRPGATLAACLAVIIGIEYGSIPIPLARVPTGREIPALHRWLAAQDGDFAFVEYPIVRRLQLWQVYFSSYHWKRSVTGASAFPSPVYVALHRRQENVPSPETLKEFEKLGVRYLVVHERPVSDAPAGYLEDPHVDPEQLDAALGRLADRVRLATVLESYDVLDDNKTIVVGGRARVYELARADWRSSHVVRSFPELDRATLLTDRRAWIPTARPRPARARLAIDGDPSTRWDTEAQKPGDYLQLDLGAPALIEAVVLDAFPRWDYPRGYRVEVSPDGVAWSTVAEDATCWPPLTELLRPGGPRVEIQFPAVSARHVRIVQTGSDPDHWWSISEVNLRRSRGPGAPTRDPPA